MITATYFEAIDHGTHSEYVESDHTNWSARFGYGVKAADGTWIVHTTQADAQAYAQHLLEVSAL